MIIKVVFYVGGDDVNVIHDRIIEVYDFHIETLSDEVRKKEPNSGIHELIYHTAHGFSGTLRLGNSTEGEDHLYIMENGSTVDHMIFSA